MFVIRRDGPASPKLFVRVSVDRAQTSHRIPCAKNQRPYNCEGDQPPQCSRRMEAKSNRPPQHTAPHRVPEADEPVSSGILVFSSQFLHFAEDATSPEVVCVVSQDPSELVIRLRRKCFLTGQPVESSAGRFR